MARSPIKLFWYVTPNRFEDWFVIARSARSAQRWAHFAEGCFFSGEVEDEVEVELICRVPEAAQQMALDDLAGESGDWPEDELLTACGAEFIIRGESRVVRIGERLFHEGGAPAQRLERRLRLLTDHFEALAHRADTWLTNVAAAIDDAEELAGDLAASAFGDDDDELDHLMTLVAEVRDQMDVTMAVRDRLAGQQLSLFGNDQRASGDALTPVAPSNDVTCHARDRKS